MGKKRTNLPLVTQNDVTQYPGRLRRTPTGGYAWKCGLCGRYASSLTNAGELRCYAHGGVPESKRVPAEIVKAREHGRNTRPPGRPLEHGFYSRSERVNLQKLVDDYRERQLKVDDTEPDMLHLRARIENNLQLEPQIEELEGALQTLLGELQEFRTLPVEGENVTVEGLLKALGELNQLDSFERHAHRLMDQVMGFEREVKQDHERIIKMAKVRSEVRKADAAAKQVDAFSLLLDNFMVVLSEMLTPDEYRALQVRIKHDFETLPRRALEPGTQKLN